MIRFERNTELDIAMKNLIRSMVDVSDYITTISHYMGMKLTRQKEKDLIEILRKYNVPQEGLKYDLKVLTENPYFKDVKLDSVDSETVNYEKATIKKRTLISTNFHQLMGKYLFHHHPIGYFEADIDLPVLKEGKKIWMSPAISELESMGEGTEKGHGKCLTIGLGIGVLPYLWLLKDEVESVTVVEINQDVIDLFEKYIRPQFRTAKKLEIIHGDAFDYYNEDFLNQFDYVYVDFWESSGDGLGLYTRLMKKKRDLPHVDFWVEDSMLHNVKYIIAPYLYAVYEGRCVTDFISSTDGDLKELATKVNRYFKTRNDVVRTEDELLSIIHGKDVLREILAQ
ncbi:hypothetical protein [Desulfosporosinus lacus]|uniref:Spermine/spermidine synthase n=1 Tax=Desulfosporosinus lacus DSM 15449 TaxID=1121420 RepID=A0A1M5XKW6_9FIRM|nr:hypothetical protein [Desulfosporosinus lacus]SHI00485.1 Spermine/spermidine synthase [Desulfosporosinus lacus DSM 15449]